MARSQFQKIKRGEKADLAVWDWVPTVSQSVKARTSRRKFDRVAFKSKSVYFPPKAWNLFLAAKKRAEKEDPRRRLYPYEFTTEMAIELWKK